MVRKLIEWSLNNPLVVILLAVAVAAIGVFSFVNVNVEAYPDPAPAIVEVVAQFPGASAEEVERQVTIPLEVTFAGMPGLKAARSARRARTSSVSGWLAAVSQMSAARAPVCVGVKLTIIANFSGTRERVRPDRGA